MSTILQHPSARATFDVRSEAAKLVAAYRAVQQAQFDPPTPEQFETLDVVEALHRLCERVGAERLQHLLYFVASARGEAMVCPSVASELLAALILCRSCLNEEVIATSDLDHPTIRRHAKAAEQADAAIAKAEGRA